MSGSLGTHESLVNKPLWPEDTVEYRLYLADEKLESLNTLAVDCTHFARSLLRGHLWNYGGFALAQWKEGTSYPAHLYGRTCFHDNIEDEWLILHLLFALSKSSAELIISVEDGDGEFLLIEVAHCLPRWLKPETATNRVFIHKGLLHIIPKPRSPADVTRFPVAMPTIREAIRLVGDPLIETAASEAVQKAVQSRIKSFSGSLDFLYHSTHCLLPLPAAHVMSHDPQLVPAIVHALCERDPSDTQACRRIAESAFSPVTHTSLMVDVRFSKLLYAKLLHQQFSAPRNGGFSVPPPGNPRHRACDLGMKLTCGLEMLLRRVRGASGDLGEASVECDPRWIPFVANLKDKGYFRGEMEGSKLHQQLLASAKEYFLNSSGVEAGKEESDVMSTDTLLNAGQRILYILKTVPYSEEELKMKWAELKPCDDDSWLNLDPNDLDSIIQESAGYPLPSPNDCSQEQASGDGELQGESKVTDSGELDLQSLVFGMKSFVDKVSTHKGAEFPWTADAATGVDFDPDCFIDTIQNMLGQSVARQPSPGSDSEGTLSGDEKDDLSISSEESVTSDPDDELQSGDCEDATVTQLMAEMDLELAQTELGKSFERVEVSHDEDSRDHSEEEIQPVNVDFNLVKNLLDSYSSQGGGAGPASNILHSLGVRVPEQLSDNREE